MLDLSKLNTPQREAVTFGAGAVLVLAGPGSGKTYTISNRILYLLNNGVSPSEITVITFTKEAAQSMKERFLCLSGAKETAVYFGTFHSFFYHILTQSNHISKNSLITEQEKKKIVYDIFQKYLGTYDDQIVWNEEMENFIQCIGYYKNTLDMEKALSRCNGCLKSDFKKMFLDYQKRIKNYGKIDFDDMQYLCLELLRHSQLLREQLQQNIVHLLIDEFQDMNPVQYEIVRLLTAKHHNVFAVGDDDQSIYGFRGADPRCIRKYMDEYHPRQILLNINYRSGQAIIDASLKVINQNKNRVLKQLYASNQAMNCCVKIKRCSTIEKERKYISRRIRREVALGNSCAVIFRTNRKLQQFSMFLNKVNVLYNMGNQKNPHCVSLYTVHGAKGLEFDTVFLPDCNEGVYPHGREGEEEYVEEERRIFYVGMSRAKKCLELLYLTGTMKSSRRPSVFLKPILRR